MKIILFDGVCNFCNATVNFILKKDKQIFRFSPQQSEQGRRLLEQHGKADTALKTIVFIDGSHWLVGVEPVISITRQLRGYSWLSILLRIIPRKNSKALYAFIARNRYRWFEKRDAYRLPEPGEQQRFF